jgi:hypothetical protein
MSYPILHFIQNPRVIKDYPRDEWIKIFEEALDTNGEETFVKLMKVILEYYPWYIQYLSRMHPWSIYPYKELFENTKKKFTEISQKKFSEINFITFMQEFDECADTGRLKEEAYQTRFLQKAFSFLSAEEYRLFRQIIDQDMKVSLRDKIWEFVSNYDYAHLAYKDFFKAKEFSEFFKDEVLFENYRNEEYVFTFSEDLKFYGRYGRIFYEIDIESHKKGKFIELRTDKVFADISDYIEEQRYRKDKPHAFTEIFVFSGKEFIGILNDVKKTFFFNSEHIKRISRTIEHIFYIKLLNKDTKGVLFFREGRRHPKTSRPYYKVKKVLAGEDLETKKIELISDFEVIPFVLFNGKYGTIKGLSENGQEFFFGEMDYLNSIPATQREFDLIIVNGSFKILKRGENV